MDYILLTDKALVVKKEHKGLLGIFHNDWVVVKGMIYRIKQTMGNIYCILKYIPGKSNLFQT
jgi:hypothetical protein